VRPCPLITPETEIRHTIIKIKTLNYDGVPWPGKTGHKKGHTGRGFREKIFRNFTVCTAAAGSASAEININI